MNLIDIIIILLLILFIYDGIVRGLMINSLELFGFVIALTLAFILHGALAGVLNVWLSIPLSFSKVIAFFLLWLFIDMLYSIAIYYFYRQIPEKTRKCSLNKWSGFLPSFLKGIILIAIVLSILLSLPFGTDFKDSISDSFLASRIAGKTGFLEPYYKKVFGGAVDDVVTFFTVRTHSDEFVELKSRPRELAIDEASEREMLSLVNGERIKRGLVPLKMNRKLQKVARAHSRDMFERSYFSHINPDGLSPFDRLKRAEIKYSLAGENLALAPSVFKAHTGLMNSPGHRENILTSGFRKVGIGVVDGGIYGKMFTQNFTD